MRRPRWWTTSPAPRRRSDELHDGSGPRGRTAPRSHRAAGADGDAAGDARAGPDRGEGPGAPGGEDAVPRRVREGRGGGALVALGGSPGVGRGTRRGDRGTGARPAARRGGGGR